MGVQLSNSRWYAKGISRSMKKTMLFGALLLCAVGVGSAQESRQDFSASAYGLFSPDVNGLGVLKQSDKALGFLGSYRYSVTPRSSLELNYSFLQNTEYYHVVGRAAGVREAVHSRMQEISGAYVYSRNYKNFNPFAEVGVGGMVFTPVRDFGTSELDTRQNTNIGGLFGAGLAYEISPSFDIRAEYRGFLVKTPTYGKDDYKTNRYEFISMPALGIAYHF